VHQAVNGADIYENAKIGQAADLSFNNASLNKIFRIAICGNGSELKSEDKETIKATKITIETNYDLSPTNQSFISKEAITDINAFLSNDVKTDILIKTALVHHKFLLMQPYEYYNGIIGRILIMMILYEADIINDYIIGFSEQLNKIKDDYRSILRTTRYSGGFITLVKFFVRVFYDSARLASDRIEEIHKMFKEDENKIVNSGEYVKNLMLVYRCFKEHVYSQIKIVSNVTNLSFNTAAKSINTLCKLNILSIENEQSRHRVFVYDKLKDTLTREITA